MCPTESWAPSGFTCRRWPCLSCDLGQQMLRPAAQHGAGPSETWPALHSGAVAGANVAGAPPSLTEQSCCNRESQKLKRHLSVDLPPSLFTYLPMVPVCTGRKGCHFLKHKEYPLWKCCGQRTHRYHEGRPGRWRECHGFLIGHHSAQRLHLHLQHVTWMDVVQWGSPRRAPAREVGGLCPTI